MQKQPISHFRRIINAFRYSCDGLKAAFQDEAAFRQVVLLSVCLIIVACVLPFYLYQRVILIMPLFLSLIVELLNSAIENVVDMTSPDFHPMAKKAKDMGSAAQLVALTLIVVVWVVVLCDRFL